MRIRHGKRAQQKSRSQRRGLVFRPRIESLEARQVFSVGPFITAADPYLTPVAPGVEITPIVTVGDEVDQTGGGTYRAVGIMDGMGAYDNGDGTFTVLMNHELVSTAGVPRDHGAKGAFVSKWVIDKQSLEVISGDDLIKTVMVWDTLSGGYISATTALNRLCSADLPDEGAFYNPATGLGTTERIFMNGEETSNGRAFANVVTGSEAGVSYELPWAGKYAWENHVASPFPQNKTVVVGLDDSRREFSSEGAAEPSEVYVWVGDKKSSGIAIDKAGLYDGVLHGVRVGLPGSYDANEATVVSGERFELAALSDQTNNATFAPLQAEAIANTVTQFRRVEDGHFDPNNPDDFYFVTTDAFGGASRLWRLRFDDITSPESGGVIDVVIDGAIPASQIEMLDNMTVDAFGNAMLQEDVGNQVHLGKIWQYKLGSGDLIEVARHNADFFLDTDPLTAGVQSVKDLNPSLPGNQGTQDEESSGVIDLSAILGEGYYLANVQAHLAIGGELVEPGQLLVINTNAVSADLVDGVLTVQGTINDDVIHVSRHGNTITIKHDGEVVGAFSKRDVDKILVDASFGDDLAWIDGDVQQDAILLGGGGNDLLRGGKGRSLLIGGEGVDLLLGNSDSDILIGGTTVYDADHQALCDISDAWGAHGSYRQRVNGLRSLLNSATVLDDGSTDYLFGAGSQDWFFSKPGDRLLGRHSGELVN